MIVGAHDNWHTPMSIAAIQAGKDVYCQKPLGLDFGLTGILRKVVREKKRIFQFGTQYRSMGRYRQMVQLVRNGYIGKLQRIDLWCRDVSFNVDQYAVKPYGSAVEVPVPADLDFDAWQGPSPMVPYTVDRATCWGGYHCPETSLGFIAGCGIHELGLAQWGNKSDHTSPIRYAGTGSVPKEGIFRTLERWDVTCDYANGVKLRFMDFRTAKPVATQYLHSWHPSDGVIFHGSEGWISDAEGFCASNPSLWKQKFKPERRTTPGLAGTQPELHRLRQVAAGDDLPGGDGDPLRRDLPVGEHRGDRPGARSNGTRNKRRSSTIRRRPRCSSGRTARNGRCGEPCTTNATLTAERFLQHSARRLAGAGLANALPARGPMPGKTCRREDAVAPAIVHLDRAIQFPVGGKGVRANRRLGVRGGRLLARGLRMSRTWTRSRNAWGPRASRTCSPSTI